VVAGGLLTALAIWVSTSDRTWGLANRAVFILVWVGFMAIFRGVSDVALAFSLRRLATQDIPVPRLGAPVPQPSAGG
jgi:hypothetical protein